MQKNEIITFCQNLSKNYPHKRIQKIDWTHITVNNSIIINISIPNIGDFELSRDYIPELFSLEISIVAPIFVISKIKERKRFYSEKDGKMIYTPLIFEPITNKDLEGDMNNMLNDLMRASPKLKRVEREYACANLHLFSKIILRNSNKN